MHKGATLIEVVIYLCIVGAVLVGAFNFSWEIIYGNIKSQAIREVQQNSRFAIEKISGAVLDAAGINNINNGYLSLAMQDSNLDPTIFELIDNTIVISQGVNGPYELTNHRVKVINLQFSDLSYLDTPGTIRIEMTMEYVNPNNLNQYQTSLDIKDTVSLRK